MAELLDELPRVGRIIVPPADRRAGRAARGHRPLPRPARAVQAGHGRARPGRAVRRHRDHRGPASACDADRRCDGDSIADRRRTTAERMPDDRRRERRRARDMPDADSVRAIEAIVLVAVEPVPPDLLAQLLELPVVVIEQLCAELAGAATTRPATASSWSRSPAATATRPHADLAPYVERFLLDGQRARMSGAALETLAIVAYKQPISRAQIASIRGVDPDGVLRTLQARGYVTEVARDTGPARRSCSAPRRRSSRSSASTRWPTCRRSPSSCPAPRSSRRSSTACASIRPALTPSPVTDLRPTRRREPPLWEQWAARSAALPQGERLQKVLAVRGLGQPAGVRGADRRRPGDGQRRGRRARPPGRRRARRRRGRRRADRRASRASSTTCSTSRPASSRRPATRRAGRPWSTLVPDRAAGVPRRPARRRHRGPAAADQRRRAGPPAHPSEPRRREGVPGRGRRVAPSRRASCAGCARASSSTTA